MNLAIKNLLEEDEVDAIATLGAVIKGGTDHDVLVSETVARAITNLSLQYDKPIGLAAGFVLHISAGFAHRFAAIIFVGL